MISLLEDTQGQKGTRGPSTGDGEGEGDRKGRLKRRKERGAGGSIPVGFSAG